MNGRRVVFLDSGIGGLPYCAYFVERNPHTRVLYIADREHFPYGAKSKEELVALLSALIARTIERLKPAIIVLACNTASVSALPELRKRFNHTLFVGTVPAVKPAVLESKAAHIGVLGTARTIEDSYIGGLAASTGKACEITRIAAPELVEFVENSFLQANDEQKVAITKKYIDQFRAAGADAVVLGCKHFLFLLDEFKEAAACDIAVYDSLQGVCGRIESLLEKLKMKNEKLEMRKDNILLVTGEKEIEDKWREVAALYNMKAFKFEDFAG
jgi:glutamate racemase